MRIIPRSEWGARHDDGGGSAPLPASLLYLHHSVTIAPDLLPPFSDDYAAIRTLEGIGEARFGRGISYTYLITPAGLIFQGHSDGRLGAHTKGYNSTARAICLVGNYEVSEPTQAQVDAVRWLIADGHRRRVWSVTRLTGGHYLVKATACPGKHAMAAIAAMNMPYVATATQEEDDDMKLTDTIEFGNAQKSNVLSIGTITARNHNAITAIPAKLDRIATAIEANTAAIKATHQPGGTL